MTPQQDKDRTEDRDRRYQQNQHAHVDRAHQATVRGARQRSAAHRTLRLRVNASEQQQDYCRQHYEQ
jgi:hypothetical protein